MTGEDLLVWLFCAACAGLLLYLPLHGGNIKAKLRSIPGVLISQPLTSFCTAWLYLSLLAWFAWLLSSGLYSTGWAGLSAVLGLIAMLVVGKRKW